MGLLNWFFGRSEEEEETVKPAQEEWPIEATPDGPVDRLTEDFSQAKETHAFWRSQLERSLDLDNHDEAAMRINSRAETEARNRRDQAHVRLSLNIKAIAEADGIERVWCGHPDCYGMFYPHEH